MHPIPKGFMLEVITQKVDSSAVAHPNGEKVAGSFADRPLLLNWHALLQLGGQLSVLCVPGMSMIVLVKH